MGGAICAERAAMVQLRFVPKFSITKLVIATDSLAPIAPGMLCREFLAGHTTVPWDLAVISTACHCTRCHLKDAALFGSSSSIPPPSCLDGHAEHAIPTLQTTIAALYPHPSPYTRLTASQSVILGEAYSESVYSTRDIDSLQETAKRLLELAILEAKQNVVDDIHPISFGAAVMFENESIVTSHQASALEYGCTLDAVSQLAAHLQEETCAPVLLVQADQYGIAHAPFAPARSFLSEHGFGDCLVLLHSIPLDDCNAAWDTSDSLDAWELKEVRVADLAPNAPSWTTSLEVDYSENGDVDTATGPRTLSVVTTRGYHDSDDDDDDYAIARVEAEDSITP
jgi:hypothetical protein